MTSDQREADRHASTQIRPETQFADREIITVQGQPTGKTDTVRDGQERAI